VSVVAFCECLLCLQHPRGVKWCFLSFLVQKTPQISFDFGAKCHILYWYSGYFCRRI